MKIIFLMKLVKRSSLKRNTNDSDGYMVFGNLSLAAG